MKMTSRVLSAAGLVLVGMILLAGCEKPQTKHIDVTQSHKVSFSSRQSSSMANANSSSDSLQVSSLSDYSFSDSSSDDKVASSSSSTNSQSSDTVLDISGIKNGDYSSLKGGWQEVAIAGAGLHGGQGLQWSQDTSDLTNKMHVTDRDISDGTTILSNTQLYQEGGPFYVDYSNNNGVLTASTDNDDDQNYSVSFYPKGVSVEKILNNGVEDDTSTNRIIFWTSNNNYTELFEQK